MNIFQQIRASFAALILCGKDEEGLLGDVILRSSIENEKARRDILEEKFNSLAEKHKVAVIDLQEADKCLAETKHIAIALAALLQKCLDNHK